MSLICHKDVTQASTGFLILLDKRGAMSTSTVASPRPSRPLSRPEASAGTTPFAGCPHCHLHRASMYMSLRGNV